MKIFRTTIMQKTMAMTAVFAVVLFAAAQARATEPFKDAVIHPPALNPDAAFAMVEACRALAKKNNWNVSIAVVDASGALMAFHRMANTSFNSIQSAILKAKTSAIVRSSTKDLSEKATNDPNPALVAAHQVALGFYTAKGGVPIFVDNIVVGGIGVGGHPTEDEQCARAGIDAVLK